MKKNNSFLRDIRRAFVFWEMASNKGLIEAHYRIGYLNLCEDEININEAQGKALIQKTVFKNSISGLIFYPFCFDIRSNERIELLSKLIQNKNPFGFWNFAIHLSSGDEAKQNKKLAAQFYLLAAEKGCKFFAEQMYKISRKGKRIFQKSDEISKYFLRLSSEREYSDEEYLLYGWDIFK
jgi:hypothetical protein